MIGVGIDRDATNAAIKAIQDVMDRNTTFDSYDKLNLADNSSPRRELSILLGVPPPLTSEIHIRTQSIPSSVNVAVLLQKLFPNCHQKQSLPSIRIQVGGLNIQESNGSTTTDCEVGTSPGATSDNRIVVVAHLSFDAPSSVEREFQYPLPKAVLETSTTMQQRSQTMKDKCTQEMDSCRSNSTIPLIDDNHREVSPVYRQGMEVDMSILPKHTVTHGFRTAAVSPSASQRTESSSQSSTIVNASKDMHLASNETVYNFQRDQPVKRNSLSSIDLLAQISASIIDDSHKNGSISAKLREDLNPRVNIKEQMKKEIDFPVVATKPNRKTSMNKLPLNARTPKNHTRHFVQHSYLDYSQEIPPVVYENRTNAGSTSAIDGTPISTTTSLPFPLKLHEALTTIEFDKKDNIFGWLPHGRSFKIHHQVDFASVILPQYFVMTKKSSFLRQLNLYGFRRISDGSYYHERFLRGMSFLCQSMQRQKVNGNGVRAAGNPDDEPNLAEYPACPPSQRLDTSYRVLSVKIPSTISSLPLIEQNLSPVHGDAVQIRESGSSSGDNDDRASSGEYVAKDGNNVGIFLSSDDGNDCDDENDYNETATVESSTSSSSSSPTHLSSPNGNNNMNVSCTQRNVTFPLKLQRILDQLERDGLTDIISWLPHGRAFIVRDVDRFVKNILPLHFSHSKYSSFQRQCHMYHFVRINHGPDKGAYYHHQLLRGRPDLSANIHRSRGNSNKTMMTGQRSLSLTSNEPNLYLLPPLPAISS